MKGSWLRSLVLFLSVAVAGLSLSACSSTPVSATTITTVAVTGITPFIGSTAQYACTVTFSDSTTQDVTSKATWVSSNTAVLTVSSSGIVTAVAPGTAILEATYQGVAGTIAITVTTGATVSSVAVNGTVPAIGSTSQFTSTATFSDGTTQDVTSTAAWVSFNAAVARVSSSGVVTAVATGTAVVKATYQGSSGTFTLTVTQ
jgi:trimeric autotransporter adhesin